MMKLLLAVFCAVALLGQDQAITYAIRNGTTGGSNLNINSSAISYGVVFTAPSATTVDTVSVYAGAVGSANVDSLRMQVVEMMGATPGAIVTYTDASDVVNLTANALSNGDTVRFWGATSLPAGLTSNTNYFVCSTAGGTFQVDDDSGCASIVTDFSGSSGTQYVFKAITSSTTFTPTPVTAGSWIDFSSFSAHTLVSGRKYVAFLLNTESVPGTDSVRIDHLSAELPTMVTWSQNPSVGSVIGSSNRGASTTPGQVNTGYVAFASGLKSGSSFATTETNTAMRVNGSRRAGVKFTTPANVKFNLSGAAMQIRSGTGSWPKLVTIELYSVGSTTDTLISSCEASAFQYTLGANSTWQCQFAASTALEASATYRIAMTATGGSGDSSNYLSITSFISRTGETFSQPWSIQQTSCAGSCTTTANWTDLSTRAVAFSLLLDNTTPYASIGSGGAGGSYVVAQ